jgi:AraC-like DNA-binding protein
VATSFELGDQDRGISPCQEDPTMSEQIRDLAARVAHLTDGDGIHATALPRVSFVRSSRPTQDIQSIHEPALCLVLQGAKRVMLGEAVFRYGAAQHILVSYDLPVVGQITMAEPGMPYLCLKLDIDSTVLNEIGVELRRTGDMLDPRPAAGPGLTLGTSAPELVDAANRLVRLLDTPEDIGVLAGLYERELLYRVMRAPEGRALLGHVLGLNRGPQIARAIAWIRAHYRERFDMCQVAEAARLQPSALHQHFKALTMMSPLQYHKHLRLQEARRLMLFESRGAAAAAFAVGYESPSQFSREYRRQFGASPARDVENLAGLFARSDHRS